MPVAALGAMLVWLVPWVSFSVMFCLALLRAAARPQPGLDRSQQTGEESAGLDLNTITEASSPKVSTHVGLPDAAAV